MEKLFNIPAIGDRFKIEKHITYFTDPRSVKENLNKEFIQTNKNHFYENGYMCAAQDSIFEIKKISKNLVKIKFVYSTAKRPLGSFWIKIEELNKLDLVKVCRAYV